MQLQEKKQVCKRVRENERERERERADNKIPFVLRIFACSFRTRNG